MNRTHRHPRPASRRHRAGFAFTEVLFAVMVLGLGFIMIAAMFPVTISQTQTTVQETAAAGVARGAFQALAQCPKLALLEPTASGNKTLPQCPFWPLNADGGLSDTSASAKKNLQEIWQALSGNFIDSQNPRYGWTALYRRAPNEKVAQVIVIATQNPTGGPYTVQKHVLRPDSSGKFEAALEPKMIAVKELRMTAEGTEIVINKTLPTSPSEAPEKVVQGLVREGAYIVIGNVAGSTLHPSYIGRIFQLGPRLDSSDDPADPMVFQAQAGTEINAKDPKPPTAGLGNPGVTAYIVGRNYTDEYTGGAPPAEGNYTGTTQEIGIYTGYIQIP